MDHLRILRRAFSITLNYRALWVFGILLALSTGGSSGSPGSPGGGGGGSGRNGFPPGNGRLPDLSNLPWNAILTGVIVLICFLVLLGIAFTILRYISETAAIRMVNEHERTGEKVSVGQGFRWGWSRPALRIFLIDLLFGLVGFVAFVLLFGIALAPLLLWVTDNQTLGVLGTIITIGLVLLAIFLLVVAGIAVSLVMPFIRRAAVLEERGVFESVRRGVELVRRRLGDVFVMGLILFALGIGWAIVMIPVVILLLLAGVVVGGLPALLAWVITGLFARDALPLIVAGVVGVPITLLVLILPLLFLGALVEIFKSSVWTLTYREVLALETAAPLASATIPPDEEGGPAEETPPAPPAE